MATPQPLIPNPRNNEFTNMPTPRYFSTALNTLSQIIARLAPPQWHTRAAQKSLTYIRQRDITRIDILTVPATQYVAQLVHTALTNEGIQSDIVTQQPAQGFSTQPYIVIAAHAFKTLPPHYIAYQLEQHISGVFNKAKRLNKLRRAMCIMDYSQQNIAYLQQQGIPAQQLFHVPICAHAPRHISELTTESSLYDVAFYGDTQNPRRQNYLSTLTQHCKLHIINNAYGANAWAQLARANMVLNIHYYEHALLETTRLYECISNGMLVISEAASDMDEHTALDGIIDFVPIGDIAAMQARIEYWRTHPEERARQYDAIHAYAHSNQHQFKRTLAPILNYLRPQKS